MKRLLDIPLTVLIKRKKESTNIIRIEITLDGEISKIENSMEKFFLMLLKLR